MREEVRVGDENLNARKEEFDGLKDENERLIEEVRRFKEMEG